MIGLLIISHYGLGKEFRIALEHVCGKQEQFQTISILKDDTIDDKIDDVLKAVKQVDSGQGVLIITDIYGATPSNIAFAVLEHDVACEVISGMNLPMLVKLASVRKRRSLKQLALEAKASGRNKIFLGEEMVCRYTNKVKPVA